VPAARSGSDGGLAVELTAWMQTLALTETEAPQWDPKKSRLRQFSIADGSSDMPGEPT